jgi:hypothetical protein
VVKKEGSTAAVGDEKIEVEYVNEDVKAPEGMEEVFKNFLSVEELLAAREEPEEAAESAVATTTTSKVEEEQERKKKKWKSEEAEEQKVHLTKPKRKEMKRFKVAQLKQMVSRPEVVDMHDVSSMDPLLLIHLRVSRNAGFFFSFFFFFFSFDFFINFSVQSTFRVIGSRSASIYKPNEERIRFPFSCPNTLQLPE